MRAAIAAIAAIALLTVTFAGCLSTDGETKGLAAVYGSANVLEIAGISIINGPGPMGHLGANGTDTQVVSMNIEVPKQTITKTNTQPANGQAIALTPAAVNTTAAFTLPKASQLGDYQTI